MKTVYLVRHGQSEGNVGSVFQHADSPLTDHGKQQVQFIAERCARLNLDLIMSSPQPRAASTAQIISEKTLHEVVFSDLFMERRKPSSMEGKLHSDSEARLVNRAWWASLAGRGPRVEDGENFNDLKDRALEALVVLAKRSEEHILIVTHSFFLRYLLGAVLFGEKMTPEQFEPLMSRLWHENTGMSVFLHQAIHPELENGKPTWSLRTWNDHAHLG